MKNLVQKRLLWTRFWMVMAWGECEQSVCVHNPICNFSWATLSNLILWTQFVAFFVAHTKIRTYISNNSTPLQNQTEQIHELGHQCWKEHTSCCVRQLSIYIKCRSPERPMNLLAASITGYIFLGCETLQMCIKYYTYRIDFFTGQLPSEYYTNIISFL